MKEYIPFFLLPFAFFGINEIGKKTLSKPSEVRDFGKKMYTIPIKPTVEKNIIIGRTKLHAFPEHLITTLYIRLTPYKRPITTPFAPPKPTDAFFSLIISGEIWEPGFTGTTSSDTSSEVILNVIRDAITEERFAIDQVGENFVFDAGYKKEDILKLLDIWERWHMNDMRPGTKKQMDAIDEKTGDLYKPKREKGWGGILNTYEEECDYLKSIGLLVDDGHKYGYSSVFEPLPGDVVDYLRRI